MTHSPTLAPATAHRLMTTDAVSVARRRSSRILIAEDDEPLRHLLRKALTAAGFQVDDVATGHAAREAYEANCPDVLLADLVLPGLNGQELANACRQQCPEIIMIFMSGYSEDELHRLDIKQVVFLPKPLEIMDLVETLDHLLAARETG